MKIVRNIAKMQELSLQTRSAGLKLGFVPTMGFLHDGHLALVRRARELADVVAVSIFVNPTQFDRKDDFEAYPRDEATDEALLEEEGVDFLLMPDASDVYPQDASTSVSVSGITTSLCGSARPGHFDGVATVVSSLFHMVQPDFAVFGQKDFQQLQVIRRMVRDLHFPVKIVGVATEREADGLAMSSRNARLTDEQREAAPAVYRSLLAVGDAFDQGQRDASALLGEAKNILDACPGLSIDYLELVDRNTLEPVAQATKDSVVAVAAFFDTVRLIDNFELGGGDNIAPTAHQGEYSHA